MHGPLSFQSSVMLDDISSSSKYWLKPELCLMLPGSGCRDAPPELCGVRGALDTAEVDICPSITVHHSSTVDASHRLSQAILGRLAAGTLRNGAVSNSPDISASWMHRAKASLGID